MRPIRRDPIEALLWATACHTLFVLAVAGMAWGLATGLRGGAGTLTGGAAVAADLALLLGFPVAHSALLTRRGRRALRAAVGTPPELDTTLYASTTAALLLAVFGLWSPLDGPLVQLHGPAAAAAWAAYAAGWTLLAISMMEAGLAVQTGAAGWLARLRGQPVRYPPRPRHGLHGLVRHPIYAAFALVLWSGPEWTIDKLLMATTWTAYCVVGAGWKAAREARREAPPAALPRSATLPG